MSKLTFDEFKETVKNEVKEFLPENFHTADIKLKVFEKNNNVKLTGLIIESDCNMSPTIYIDNFYKKYQKGTDINIILQEIAKIRMEYDVTDDFDVTTVTDFNKCRKKIMPRLIGAEENSEILKVRPHIRIENLAVTFCIDLGENKEGLMSVPVQFELMETWNVTAEQLYEIALENLTKADIGVFIPMKEILFAGVLSELKEICDGDEEEARRKLDQMIPDNNLWVLTNKRRVNGANMLLDRSVMEDVIKEVGTDFFILPSSIHECIILPADSGMDSQQLETMVCEVNETQVEKEERLSNSVYRYTLENGITLA